MLHKAGYTVCAQQVLAVDVADRFARALGDLARHLQHLDAVGQDLQQPVQPCFQVEGLEQRLLLVDADVQQPGDDVGELAGAFDGLQRGDHLGRHLRQQLQRLQRALLQRTRAAFDLGVDLLGVVEVLHLGDGERITLQHLQHAKAPQTARDGMVHAVGGGDIAQHRGAGADPVQVAGRGVFGLGLALQQHADRPLQAHRLLHRRLGLGAGDGQREHRGREQHHAAHRQDDQRVVGNRAHAAARPCAGVGRARCRAGGCVGGGAGGVDRLVHQRTSPRLAMRSTRQPCVSSGSPSSSGPGGSVMRRSKTP